jgi:hypothetical protein
MKYFLKILFVLYTVLYLTAVVLYISDKMSLLALLLQTLAFFVFLVLLYYQKDMSKIKRR